MTVKIAHLCPVTAACLLLLLSSCVFDRESCPPVEGSGAYSLSIRIGAQALATRAVDDKEQEASKAEDFINVEEKDYCVYLLDGDGRVKQRFVPTAMTLAPNSDKVYELTGNFIPDMDQMQVMVLANWGGAFGGEYGYDLIGRSLEDLYAGDGDGDGDGSLIFTYPATDGKSWMPSESAKEGIPMFGLSEVFEVKKELSIPNNRYEVTVEKEVKMLRSLSKVEVTNETARNPDGTDEDGHSIEIVSCRLTGYNTTGRFIPDLRGGNAEWDKDQTDGTKQVVSPSMPADGGDYSAAGLLFGGNEGDASFTAYVPEMDFTTGPRPKIEVILSIDEEEHEPYYIELADYEEGAPKTGGEYEALLRNHHYKFNITEVEVGVSTDLYIHVETKNWDMDEDELTYNDLAVEFTDNGVFHWTRADYDPAEKGVVDKDGVSSTADKDRRSLLVTRQGGAEGVFIITEPVRGTWTLALYAADDTDNSAFQIDLWGEYDEMQDDGTTVTKEGWIAGADAVSGRITGEEEVRFRIVATGDNISPDDYSARLTMSVTTFDDRMFYVNLPYCNEHSADDSFDSADMPQPTVENRGYYTIIQKTSGDFN